VGSGLPANSPGPSYDIDPGDVASSRATAPSTLPPWWLRQQVCLRELPSSTGPRDSQVSLSRYDMLRLCHVLAQRVDDDETGSSSWAVVTASRHLTCVPLQGRVRCLCGWRHPPVCLSTRTSQFLLQKV
jgi:hypothetical protein